MSSDQHCRQEQYEPFVSLGSKLVHCFLVVREMAETIAEMELEKVTQLANEDMKIL